MSFYFIQLFIFILYSLIFIGLDVQTAGAFSNINNKYFFEKLYCFISIIYLSLVMGLRSNTVGTDTPLYVYNYLINSQISEDTFSYNWLSKIVFNLTNGNYHDFLLAISFIIVASIVIGLWRIYSYFEIQYKTCYLFFSLYIYITYYYYFEAFNIFRQSLAGSIAFLAVSFLFTRNYFKWLFLFILAVGIHNTVIVLVVLLPIMLIKKIGKDCLFGVVLQY
ncbi:EpsG family protein [uncultured Lactobacillus sp.]|uniref:EpsG family protein n=1 Tax=uncultured Lactobacillus sp. TaxID=153152 RepID=UPI0025885569|nr:EpsG family protein [uncultured Lactobacillus sp.]